MQKISFNCPDELAECMKKRAEKFEGGASELIRVALEQYLQPDQKQGNMQLVLSKFVEQTYENAKTRAMVRIALEHAGLPLSDEDFDEVEEMAKEYVEKGAG